MQFKVLATLEVIDAARVIDRAASIGISVG
jgi:hypothetical protein